jgi:hypothetical protein
LVKDRDENKQDQQPAEQEFQPLDSLWFFRHDVEQTQK